MRLLFTVLLLLSLGACSTVATTPQGWVEPVEAIRAANSDPAYGVRGSFVMTVKATGEQGRWSFLNSEPDYHDQRNLTVRMPTTLVPKLEKHLGLSLHELENHRIVVMGTARRVRIEFTENGHPTGKYYFQTHVLVDSTSQVQLADTR